MSSREGSESPGSESPMPESPRPDSSGSESSDSLHPYIAAIRSALQCKQLQCPSGSLKVDPDDLVLYYRRSSSTDGAARWIDFTQASEDDLKNLSEACDRATFGRNKEDILDETYRSAGKLDRAQFSIGFDPGQSGIMATIQQILLEGHDMSNTSIRHELYKLNVYGPGQFFKAHKDTPRSTNMFASLVIVLPTVHEGGALLFRHEDRPFTFDSAKTLAQAPWPSVAFTAFFSDVEHEVAPVTAGYRVTLTYNLYFDQIMPPVSVPVLSGLDMAVRDVLTKMLADPEYLPMGGNIGFALRHEYALAKNTWTNSLKTLLKGSDAVLEQIGEELGLETSLWIAYEINEYDYYLHETLVMLCPMRAGFPGGTVYENVVETLRAEWGARVLKPLPPQMFPHCDSPQVMCVEWATEIDDSLTPFKEDYGTEGNAPGVGYLYGRLCLLMRLEPAADRLHRHDVAEGGPKTMSSSDP